MGEYKGHTYKMRNTEVEVRPMTVIILNSGQEFTVVESYEDVIKSTLGVDTEWATFCVVSEHNTSKVTMRIDEIASMEETMMERKTNEFGHTSKWGKRDV